MALTLGEATELFLMRRGIGEKTRLDNERLLRYFVTEGVEVGGVLIAPETPLAAITPEHLDRYEYALCHRERPLSPQTVFKYTYTVWGFFQFLEKRGKIAPEDNPCRFFTPQRPPRDDDSRAIPLDVLRAVVAEIRQKPFKHAIRDEAIARCLAAGLRETEVRHLEIARLDLDERVALVHRKGGGLQRRRFGPVTADVLRAWLAVRPDTGSPYVFVPLQKNRGSCKPLAEGVPSQIIRRIAHKVVGRPYGSHALRHWLGQFMADNGVPPPVVAKTLGITVEVALRHYYNQDDERVIRAVDAYELGEIPDDLGSRQ